jgi:hypothetical protein
VFVSFVFWLFVPHGVFFGLFFCGRVSEEAAKTRENFSQLTEAGE